MVRKRILSSCLIILDVIFITWLMLAEKDNYLYSKFTFSFKSFLINVCSLLIVNLLLILIYIKCKRNLVKLIFIEGLALILSVWLLIITYLFTALGVFWQSETHNYTEFNRVDEHLDSQLAVAGLKISDIIQMDVEKVENFYYWSQSQLACEKFVFTAKLYLSEQGYKELKSSFSTAKEFKEKTFSVQEQQKLGMTGYYELYADIFLHESSTTVDFWDTIVVNFCDSEKIIKIDWRGCCYT